MKDLSGLEIKDYFRIFWNRRWYWLIVWALVSIGGTYYAKQRPDVYRSEAKVAVDTPLSSIARSPSVNERVETIREQLSSRSFLEKMIQQTGSYGWGESEGFVMEQALTRIRNNIRIMPSGRMFTVAYRATDAATAQSVTKQFTDELIRISRRSSEDRVRTVDRFVEGKFEDAEGKLREINDKIREFTQRNAGRMPGQTVSNMNAIAGYRSQLNGVDNAIQQLRNNKDNMIYRHDQRLDVKDQLSKIPVPSSVNPVISNELSPEERELAQKMNILYENEEKLKQALEKWTENHPDVGQLRSSISRLEREIEEISLKITSVNAPPDNAQEDDASDKYMTKEELQEEVYEREYRRQIALIDVDIAKREEERDEILKKINEAEAQIKLTPTVEADYNDLLREQALLEKEYKTYADQKLSAGLATAVETDKDNEVYRVIDEANFPIYPEGANRSQVILMSLFGGFMLGIAAAFGRELIDNTIGSEEEAKKVFNLPVLAAIPAAPKRIKKTELRKTA